MRGIEIKQVIYIVSMLRAKKMALKRVAGNLISLTNEVYLIRIKVFGLNQSCLSSPLVIQFFQRPIRLQLGALGVTFFI